MKKHMILFGLCTLALFTVYAGGTNDSAARTGKTPLRWLVHPAYSNAGTDPARIAYLNAAISDWQKKHPDVDLQVEIMSTNNNEAMAKLLEQAAGGRAADVAMIDSFVFTNYMPYLKPLDQLLQSGGLQKDDFFPFSQDLVRGADGQFHGIQFTTDARVLFYRKDLVPVPPKTWEELLTVCAGLKAQGYDPILLPAGRAEGAMTTSIYPFFWGQGGVLVDEMGEAAFGAGENREKMLKVFQFIKQLVDSGYLPQRAATYAAESDLNAEVAAGKTAMFLGGNWQVSQLKGIIGDAELEKWDVAPIPQISGARETTCNGGWVWGIFTGDTQKQALAFDLVSSIYCNDAAMAKWTSVAGYLPTRKSVYEHPDYDKDRFTTAFRKIIDTGGRLRPVADVYPKISLELQVALSSVVSGAKGPEQALSDAWFAVTGKR
jgi:multiple sugar transport system substrate-binding protein